MRDQEPAVGAAHEVDVVGRHPPGMLPEAPLEGGATVLNVRVADVAHDRGDRVRPGAEGAPVVDEEDGVAQQVEEVGLRTRIVEYITKDCPKLSQWPLGLGTLRLPGAAIKQSQ